MTKEGVKQANNFQKRCNTLQIYLTVTSYRKRLLSWSQPVRNKFKVETQHEHVHNGS